MDALPVKEETGLSFASKKTVELQVFSGLWGMSVGLDHSGNLSTLDTIIGASLCIEAPWTDIGMLRATKQ